MSDWTTYRGRANNSPQFKALTKEVERIIRQSGAALINDGAAGVAQLIMAQLAHVHGLAPTKQGGGE